MPLLHQQPELDLEPNSLPTENGPAPQHWSDKLIEEESVRREGTGRRCCLGGILSYRSSHLAARIN